MKLGAFEARFNFGLLVIGDPESTDAHGSWDPRVQMVHAGPDSLYVAVKDSSGGLVAVTCVDGGEGDDGTSLGLLFSGRLELSVPRLKFYDPDESISMTVPVRDLSVQVDIYVDDTDEPGELLIRLVQ